MKQNKRKPRKLGFQGQKEKNNLKPRTPGSRKEKRKRNKNKRKRETNGDPRFTK